MSTSQNIYAIKDRAPEFPCWMYCTIVSPFTGKYYGWEKHYTHPCRPFDHESYWSPDAPEAPKDAPSADRKGKTLEEFCDMPPGSFAEYLKKQNAAGGPEAYAMSSTPSPLAGLPTPETDIAASRIWDQYLSADDTAEADPVRDALEQLSDFARSLEQRLAAARADVERMKMAVDHIDAAAKNIVAQKDAQLATAKATLTEKDEMITGLRGLDIANENIITALRSDLAKANAAVEANREAANKWKEYYRAAYGHPWENRNSNYQGL